MTDKYKTKEPDQAKINELITDILWYLNHDFQGCPVVDQQLKHLRDAMQSTVTCNTCGGEIDD